MKIKTNDINDTNRLAEIFARSLTSNGAFISLFGDIGAGKTAFVRAVLKNLNVKEKITSPSFVILNEYKGAFCVENGVKIPLPVYHFDLYRLENEGLESIKEELREYSKKGVLTFVEWADFGGAELPCSMLNIKVHYDENDFNDTRYYEFIPAGPDYEKLAAKVENCALKEGFSVL